MRLLALLVPALWAGIVLAEAAIAPAQGHMSLSIRFHAAKGVADPEPGTPAGQKVFAVTSGSPIPLRYTIANNGDQECRFHGYQLRAFPEAFSVRRDDGERMRKERTLTPEQAMDAVVKVPPGKKVGFDVDLLPFLAPESTIGTGWPTVLEPGTYSVGMLLDSTRRQPGKATDGFWAGRLESNTLKLKVEAPSRQERDAMWARFPRTAGDERARLALALTSSMQDTWDERTLGLLDDRDWRARKAAIEALPKYRRGDPKMAERLEAILRQDGYPPVRAGAATALGRMGVRDSVEALSKCVKSRMEGVYRAAVRGLGELGDPRAIPVLREVAETDSEEWVRKAALESIRKIEGRVDKQKK